MRDGLELVLAVLVLATISLLLSVAWVVLSGMALSRIGVLVI